jgi:hypothetical protein
MLAQSTQQACMHLVSIETAHQGDHGLGAAAVCADDFRSGICEAEAQPGRVAGACRAAKVNDCPAVLPRKPHHVAGLEVTMHKAERMQVPQSQCQLEYHLHMLLRGIQLPLET